MNQTMIFQQFRLFFTLFLPKVAAVNIIARIYKTGQRPTENDLKILRVSIAPTYLAVQYNTNDTRKKNPPEVHSVLPLLFASEWEPKQNGEKPDKQYLL